VIARNGNELTLAAPPTATWRRPPYMLFANERTAKGLVPSKSVQTFVGISGLEAQAGH